MNEQYNKDLNKQNSNHNQIITIITKQLQL